MLPGTHPEGSHFAPLHLLPEAAAGKDRDGGSSGLTQHKQASQRQIQILGFPGRGGILLFRFPCSCVGLDSRKCHLDLERDAVLYKCLPSPCSNPLSLFIFLTHLLLSHSCSLLPSAHLFNLCSYSFRSICYNENKTRQWRLLHTVS